MAELQINSIFASSPPFPVQELEADDVPPLDLEQHHAPSSHHNSARSASSSVGSAQGDRSIRVDVKSKASGFKARPVPTTTAVPSIVPKTTRAAALRAGFDLPSPKRSPASQESIAKTFENVPGHKRAIVSNAVVLKVRNLTLIIIYPIYPQGYQRGIRRCTDHRPPC